jgi:transposase
VKMSSMRETVTLNTHEQKRVMILNRILAGQLSVAEAAALLNRSHRQVQRILAAYRKEGAAAVVHGNRDRKPKQSIRDEVRKQVIALAQTTYQGCNQQHLRDLLEEREGIKLSRASVHRILQAAGLLTEPKRRLPQHRRRRKRYAPSGHVGADRREPPRLAGGAWAVAQPDSSHRRCHREDRGGGLP